MRFLMIAFVASLAFGQNSRVFQLAQTDGQGMKEIAAVLRGIGDIQQIAVDEVKKTVSVDGTPGQMALAGWLLQQLDGPASPQPVEYRPQTGGDDVVRVFYANHASTPQALQDMATAVRSMADIRRLFVESARRAVVVRATGEQVALAAWIVDQLNQPANTAAPGPQEYRLASGDVARVFELAHIQTSRQLQELVTLVRSISDIQRLFIYSARRAITVRSTPERIDLASWLVSELDKPAAPQDRAGRHEYRFPSGPDNMVRVFYLPPSEDYQKMAAQVRRNAGIPRLFVYSAFGALAARGTAGQIATAERALEEMKAQ